MTLVEFYEKGHIFCKIINIIFICYKSRLLLILFLLMHFLFSPCLENQLKTFLIIFLLKTLPSPKKHYCFTSRIFSCFVCIEDKLLYAVVFCNNDENKYCLWYTFWYYTVLIHLCELCYLYVHFCIFKVRQGTLAFISRCWHIFYPRY